MLPMLKNRSESKYRVMAKQMVDATQKKQKIPFKIDVIFNAFNVFIINTSLYFIIPHHRFNVNIFAKSLCPILIAAEGFILGVGAKIFTIAGPVILYGISAGVVYGMAYWMTTLV